VRYRILYILLFSLLLSNACREDTIVDDNGPNPGLGGDYTELSGEISGTLSINDAPFLVTDDLKINSGDTLIIEAGVVLFLNNNKSIDVEGTLLAEGTRNNLIAFRSFGDSNEDWWLGIRISNPTSVSRFAFCIIEHVNQNTNDQFTNGAIEISNSQAVIKNCVLRTNFTVLGGGLSTFNSNVTLMNNIFRDNSADNFGGAIYLQSSSSTIINNTIYSNRCYNFGGGIVFTDPLTSGIQNNIFYDNSSFKGDPRLAIVSGDSSNVMEQYNFLAFDTMDPLFVSNDNLNLTPESPCIDEGNPDTQYNDVNGTRNDQGAFGGPGGDW
jgi:predicted outer membrane repeat protein